MDVVVEDVTVVTSLVGGVAETFGGAGGGRADGFTVFHIGGCDVINHGGLGRLVVVVVVAK